jgi:hypothetical protein
MDAISDGERLWMVGADEQLACYDVIERELFEYASPDEMPSVWDGIAISGDAGDVAYKTTVEDGWSEAGVVSPDTEFLDLDAWENERASVSADDGCLYRDENDSDD